MEASRNDLSHIDDHITQLWRDALSSSSLVGALPDSENVSAVMSDHSEPLATSDVATDALASRLPAEMALFHGRARAHARLYRLLLLHHSSD